MEPSTAEIVLALYGESLSAKAKIGDDVSLQEIRIPPGAEEHPVVASWLLRFLRVVFDAMPFDHVHITAPPEVQNRLKNALTHCVQILGRTNEALLPRKEQRGLAAGNSRTLFVNTDGHPKYKALYDRFCEDHAEETDYLNFSTGFNASMRRWEPVEVPMSVDQFIEKIKTSEIKRLVLINHYLFDLYLNKTAIFLPALLTFLGVSYHIIDNDPYDPSEQGYFCKSMYNNNAFERFSTCGGLHEYWDIRHSNTNVHYIAAPQERGTFDYFSDIAEDYSILVMSHSRAETVAAKLLPVIYILDRLNEKSLFSDLQLWYHSMRYMLLNMMSLDELNLVHYNATIHNAFFAAAQFLKYEAIETIKTNRAIEIYGDIGWKVVFPEYFQDRYLSAAEKDKIFEDRRHLYLLFNDSENYLDTSAAAFDAVSRRAPFINFAPLVKADPFKGFAAIEYDTNDKMNDLIENIRSVIREPALLASVRAYRELVDRCTAGIVESVAEGIPFATINKEYVAVRRAHSILGEQTVKQYIFENEDFLRESFGALCLGHQVQVDVNRTRFKDRGYFKRLVSGLVNK